MASLDLRTDLPKIRKAFDAGELEAQTRPTGQPGRCTYSAPCAVGVCLPRNVREQLDESNGTQIAMALADGIVKCPAGQSQDWDRLQYYHDRAVGRPENMKEFVKVLEELETKYAA